MSALGRRVLAARGPTNMGKVQTHAHTVTGRYRPLKFKKEGAKVRRQPATSLPRRAPSWSGGPALSAAALLRQRENRSLENVHELRGGVLPRHSSLRGIERDRGVVRRAVDAGRNLDAIRDTRQDINKATTDEESERFIHGW